MSKFYTYIATKTTADPYLPTRTVGVDVLARDVSDAFMAISGGRFQVGKLAFFPVQRSVANHLLCDGREVPKSSFPELYQYLGDSEGAPANAANFKLPNFLDAFVPAPVADAKPETATNGTVSTPPPAPEDAPPTYYEEQTDRTYGHVDSGGRRRDYSDLTAEP